MPKSGDYLNQSTMPKIQFTHHDPDGIKGTTKVYLVVDGQFFDLAKAPSLFEVEENDPYKLVFTLDLTGIKFPHQEALFWLASFEPNGTINADRVRYRFQ